MRWIIFLLFNIQIISCEQCYKSCTSTDFNLNLCFKNSVDIKIIQDLSSDFCNKLNLNISNEVFNYPSPVRVPSPVNNPPPVRVPSPVNNPSPVRVHHQ